MERQKPNRSMKLEKIIKIILAILLLLCLLKMPYEYFQLVRYLSFVGFGYLAYEASNKKQDKLFLVYIALAILFQPFFKIALGRTVWNAVDVIVAIFLVLSILKNRHIANEEKRA